MKNRLLILVAMTSLAAAGAAGVMACSADAGQSSLPTANDAGNNGNKDTGANNPTDSGTPKDGGTSTATCDHLFAREAGVGVYCPFSKEDTLADGGTRLVATNCAPGKVCFSPPGTGSINTCENAVTDVDGGMNWECNGPTDCTGSKVCCGVGTLPAKHNTCPSKNVFVSGTYFKGTRCLASCNAANNQFTICEGDSDCTAQTCKPFARRGAVLGACTNL